MKKLIFALFSLLSIPCFAAIGGGVGGQSINFILDEGSTLTARNQLNFIGSPITCVDNAGSLRTDCTITSTGGSGGTSALEVFSTFDGTRSSPTASISIGDSLKLSVVGSTAVINVDFSSVTSRSDVILNQANLQTGAQFHVSSGSVKGQLVIYGGSIRTIILPSATEAMRLVNISSHQVFMVIQSSGTNWWKIGSDVTGVGVPSYDISNTTTNTKDISISTSDIISIGGTMAFTPLTASQPLKLNANKQVISGLISLTSDVTGTLPSGNLPTNIAYTNVSQTFSGSNIFASSQTLFSSVSTTSWANVSKMTFGVGTNLQLLNVTAGNCLKTDINGDVIDSGGSCGGGGVGSGSSIYAATSTASFPFGFSVSTGVFNGVNVSTLVVTSSMTTISLNSLNSIRAATTITAAGALSGSQLSVSGFVSGATLIANSASTPVALADLTDSQPTSATNPLYSGVGISVKPNNDSFLTHSQGYFAIKTSSTAITKSWAVIGAGAINNLGTTDYFLVDISTTGTGQGNVSIGTQNTISKLNVSGGGFAPWSRTKAQLLSIVPAQAGEQYYCSDCTTDAIVVSTGTIIGSFGRISSRTTVIQ